MNAVEFYKMSIEEYPKHKDKNSLKFSVTELQKEIEYESRFIDRYEDTDFKKDIMDGLIKNLSNLQNIVQLGRTYINNPKNCKGCINWTVTMFGERCAYLETDVNSPNDMYKHPECPVK